MSLTYPTRSFGRYKVVFGFSFAYLHHRFGLEFGERFHNDPETLIATIQAADRKIYELYGDLGLGSPDPAPRPMVEPYGDRFMPALYGCPCAYAPDIEPWARHRLYTESEILALPDWTRDRFTQAEPVRRTVALARRFRELYGPLHCLPDLGSVINTAIYLLGDDLFAWYIEKPDVIRKFYDNITQAALLALDYFPEIGGLPLEGAGLGNCSVTMLSPADYLRCNFEFDHRIMDYCRQRGLGFCIHQDSQVTPQLANYARLDYANYLSIGMDTDFAQVAKLFPHAGISCLWFPHWLNAHSLDEIRAEVRRLATAGRPFKSFTFSLQDIDPYLGEEKLRGFYAAVRDAAAEYP